MKELNFLVSAPIGSGLEAQGVVVRGSGFAKNAGEAWKCQQVTAGMLLEEARKGVRYENVELKVLSGKKQPPAPVKDKLVYGEAGGSRLWIDTKPMASSRFTSKLAVVLVEVQRHTGATVGYVVAFPDGRVMNVVLDDIIKYCKAAKNQGKTAIQNMQFVEGGANAVAHLKNYEGRSLQIHVLPAPRVNTAAAVGAKIAEVKAPVAAPVTAKAPEVDPFTPEQRAVLKQGEEEGVNIQVYADPALSPKMMHACRRIMASKKYSGKNKTMGERLAMFIKGSCPNEDMATYYSHDIAHGADIRPYFNQDYVTTRQANQVKIGWRQGIDISKFADVKAVKRDIGGYEKFAGVDITPDMIADEMEQRRVRLCSEMWGKI